MPQQSDTEAIRDSMTREVTNDAYHIAGQIFKTAEPDVSRVSNEQVDARYRQAFSTGDRTYLMQEAARDPVQFLASMNRLGVTMPPDKPLPQEEPLPKAAKANVPLPKPPESAQQPTFEQPEDVPVPPPTPPALAPPPAMPPAMAPSAPAPPPPGVVPGI
ncbi:MAG TPA: hypothetical protein VFB50_12280 [Chloroflexota bacterium]|nr:hypothetical protein [Chloroflexota bacterium]